MVNTPFAPGYPTIVVEAVIAPVELPSFAGLPMQAPPVIADTEGSVNNVAG